VAKTELWNINRLMGYRDAYWYIKYTWIGFSMTNTAKQAVVHCTFMAFQSWAAWNDEIITCSVAHEWLRKRNLKGHRHGQWSIKHFKCKISSQFCCSPSKQENNMNSFCKSLKIKKTIAYKLLTMLCWTEILLKKVWEAFW